MRSVTTAPTSSRSVRTRGGCKPEQSKAAAQAVKSVALCAIVISTPQLALGADTTINTAETTTQGPTTPELNGGDTLTIGPAGSVTVTGNDTPGISGTGVNNTVNNNGTIVTRGNATGAGSGVSGIVTLGGSATINNAGLIETYGNGLSPGGGACANNASGICAEGGGNTITNSGTINTYRSDNARGIYATGGNNTIRNTGTVTSRLSQAIGVIGGSNIVINSGIVLAAGDGDAAIRLTGGSNTLTNQGSVISQAGNSIEFVGSGNTLNLGNSSFLSGNVSLGTGTQINITTGASFSKLINYTGTLSGISASGSVPVFINTLTNQVEHSTQHYLQPQVMP